MLGIPSCIHWNPILCLEFYLLLTRILESSIATQYLKIGLYISMVSDVASLRVLPPIKAARCDVSPACDGSAQDYDTDTGTDIVQCI